jgi:energy-coupling factor transport system ATP-binding protein
MSLRVDQVSFAYGTISVLEEVDFTIEPGEAVALLGRNGAGKTTLTKLIVALLHPDAGEVWVGDWNTRGRAPEDMAARVAYVFQHTEQQLFARTVMEEVVFAPRRLGLARREAETIAQDALDLVGLAAQSETHPYDLPPAERKLVSLAAALAQKPRVLVLDEPTQGLDRSHLLRVCEILRNQVEQGVAVLAVTHDLTVVAEAMGRALVLADGRVIADEDVAHIVASEPRAVQLGLSLPPGPSLSRALDLPGCPLRMAEVVSGIRSTFGVGYIDATGGQLPARDTPCLR